VEDSLYLLSNRYKQYFMNEIFPIVLFLTPKYRDFSISRHYQKDWMVREIVILAIKWKFSKSDCTDFSSRYYSVFRIYRKVSVLWRKEQGDQENFVREILLVTFG